MYCSAQLYWIPSTSNTAGCHWLNGEVFLKKNANFSPVSADLPYVTCSLFSDTFPCFFLLALGDGLAPPCAVAILVASLCDNDLAARKAVVAVLDSSGAIAKRKQLGNNWFDDSARFMPI